jgi:hypothetical protein
MSDGKLSETAPISLNFMFSCETGATYANLNTLGRYLTELR